MMMRTRNSDLHGAWHSGEHARRHAVQIGRADLHRMPVGMLPPAMPRSVQIGAADYLRARVQCAYAYANAGTRTHKSAGTHAHTERGNDEIPHPNAK